MYFGIEGFLLLGGALDQGVRLAHAALPDRGRDRSRLDDRDPDAPRRQLLAEDVADRLEGELRRVVGAEHLDRHQAADRGVEDDAAAGRADRRQHRLGDGDVGGQVDLELAAEVGDRQRLERARDRDPGVVDQPVEACSVALLGDAVGRRGDLLGARDVEDQRLQPLGARLTQGVGVLLPADPRVDPPAARVEPERRRPPDPGRCPGDQRGSHPREAIRARPSDRRAKIGRGDLDGFRDRRLRLHRRAPGRAPGPRRHRGSGRWPAPTPRRRRVSDLGAEPVRGDLSDRESLEAGAAGAELAFHLAAHLGDWGDWEEFERGNVDGTENALAACAAAGVRRFVHCGTEAALMAGEPLVHVDEEAPLRPDSRGPLPGDEGARRARGPAREPLRVRDAHGAASVRLGQGATPPSCRRW